jgi:hypothetical protein
MLISAINLSFQKKKIEEEENKTRYRATFFEMNDFTKIWQGEINTIANILKIIWQIICQSMYFNTNI